MESISLDDLRAQLVQLRAESRTSDDWRHWQRIVTLKREIARREVLELLQGVDAAQTLHNIVREMHERDGAAAAREFLKKYA